MFFKVEAFWYNMVSWSNIECISGKIGNARSIILPTQGCYYDKCYMCSYKSSCPEKTPHDIVDIFKQELCEGYDKIKIFTSGSFFDTTELSLKQQIGIVSLAAKQGIKELTVESRPEFITSEVLKSFKDVLGEVVFEIAIGLESANNDVLKYCVNKGFTFEAFEKKANTLVSNDCLVKAYLLLKPPFLTEYEAFMDVIISARKIESLCDTISINPVSIHKGSIVEQLWLRNSYRPPYLWTLVECLNELMDLDAYVLSHPVAPGKARGIHNCGSCDNTIIKKIEEYNLNKIPINAQCDCKAEWEMELKKIF